MNAITASSESIRPVSDLRPELNVVLAYDDRVAGSVTKQFLDGLIRDHGELFSFVSRLWRFSSLEESSLFDLAARDASNADMIVLVLRRDQQIPPRLGQWIDNWLPAKPADSTALVVLLGNPQGSFKEDSTVYATLRDLAGNYRQQFFCKEIDWPAPGSKLKASIAHRPLSEHLRSCVRLPVPGAGRSSAPEPHTSNPRRERLKETASARGLTSDCGARSIHPLFIGGTACTILINRWLNRALSLCAALFCSHSIAADGAGRLGITTEPDGKVGVFLPSGLELYQLQHLSNPDADWLNFSGPTSSPYWFLEPNQANVFFRVVRPPEDDLRISRNVRQMLDNGRQIFRYDTFGSESFWGDSLRLHEAIAGAEHGGVGSGVSPATALAVGLKVDVEALPRSLQGQLARGEVDLNDPATTLALLQLDSVIGVKGFFDEEKNLSAVGIQCALCHSTVDDSFAPGIGHRLDGWPNRDLDVGAIINLSPDLSAIADVLQVDQETVRTVLQSWGPGRFDAALLLDGKAFRPDGKSGATLLPAAYGLAGVNLHTYTGWGSVTHWNGFVANLEMQGRGVFYDPRLNDAETFPVAARTGTGNVRNSPDLVTSKLPDLHLYQLAIPAPKPPPGSFDVEAATRGREVFNGKANCASCHVPPIFTEPGWNMHTPEEIGIDDFQANRSPDKRYRTTPLAGLFARSKGGFYHDGRFTNLLSVVEHYDAHFTLNLDPTEKSDLVEYLKSL